MNSVSWIPFIWLNVLICFQFHRWGKNPPISTQFTKQLLLMFVAFFRSISDTGRSWKHPRTQCSCNTRCSYLCFLTEIIYAVRTVDSSLSSIKGLLFDSLTLLVTMFMAAGWRLISDVCVCFTETGQAGLYQPPLDQNRLLSANSWHCPNSHAVGIMAWIAHENILKDSTFVYVIPNLSK